MIWTVIVGGLVAAGFATYGYYKQQIERLQNETEYKLVGFRVGKLSMDLIQIFLTLRIYSKSTIDAEILGFSTDVWLNNVKIAEVGLDKERQAVNIFGTTPEGKSKKNILPAKGYSDIGIEINVLPQEIKDNAFALIKSYATMKDLSIRADNGKVLVKVGPLKKEITFDYSTTLKELTAP